MRIENEMLARFSDLRDGKFNMNSPETTLSNELDFFFENVMDSVVSYFKEEVKVFGPS